MKRIPRASPLVVPGATFAVLALSSLSLLGWSDLASAGEATTRPVFQSADTLGIPITSDLVVANCSGCHTVDSTGRMTRLSYIRKAPEGWQSSLRRMVMLNEVDIEPDVAREIVRYLSNNHGLAPEELRPGRFEVERRMIDYRYTADEETETTCKQCHSLGRVILQRRTEDEWDLLLATHRGLYPDVDFQAFRRGGPPPDDAEDPRHPMEKAVAHLSSAFPLDTPEWAAWSATMRPPRLTGTWALVGHDAGSGPIFGTVDITGAAETHDEFLTEASYSHPALGTTAQRTGRSIVYTGFQWRGRSFESGNQDGLREVMIVERDWQAISGRWFTGAYDEFGMDVTLRRVGRDPMVVGVYPVGVQSTGTDREVRVFGANLPADLGPFDIDFGGGVEVSRVVSVSPSEATVMVRVDPDAAIGARDLFIAGASLESAIVVYDTVDRIEVTPQAGMARVGGVNFPRQFQQYEAVAYNDGPDGEPRTNDDLPLGGVDVTWSLEEYTATFEDDDLQYVGEIDQRGLFTPNVDGPNPNRSKNRNNVGDVWVVATYESEPGAGQIRARAHLLVTVPLYMRFEPWRAEQ